MESTVEEVKTIKEQGLEIMSVKWNFDGSVLAAGCSDGCIKLYNTSNFRAFKLLSNRSATNMPVTSINWKPFEGENPFLLLSSTSDGWIMQWQVSAGSMVSAFSLPGEQCLTTDYSLTGELFAAGRRDFSISIYDSMTLEQVALLEYGAGDIPGHSNRIFCVKWIAQNWLISGGWDDSVLLWDVSTQQVIRSFHGPHVCGLSIDLKGNNLLIGSFSRYKHVTSFDLGSGRKNFTKDLGTSDHPNMIFALQFSKGAAQLFCTAGKQVSFFDAETAECLWTTKTEKDSFCTDWAPNSHLAAVGNSGGFIRIYRVAIK